MDMIYTDNLTIDESVVLMPHIVGGAENHHITVRCPRVYDVLGSADVVCSIVEPGDVVAIHPIVLKYDCIHVVLFSCSSKSVDSLEKMMFELHNKILRQRVRVVCD
jgi:hypothetical protein